MYICKEAEYNIERLLQEPTQYYKKEGPFFKKCLLLFH
ncbi:hypothetical protein bcere0009_43760 [Bacillus cereus R309803]|nr:hypothetical protein bcere0009_43760 [Bacillus cereus R309803]